MKGILILAPVQGLHNKDTSSKQDFYDHGMQAGEKSREEMNAIYSSKGTRI